MNLEDPPPPAANAVRLILLIGEVRDDGRVVRFPVARMIEVPVEMLRHGLQEP